MSDSIIGFVYDGDFYEKWGTPRQGLCTDACSVIRLNSDVEVPEGVHAGSPAIVLFVFHLNTSKPTLIGGQLFARLPSKIKMPKCPTGKQSVFATRTPHRPNPIGLTVTMISWIDTNAGLIELQGSDLIVGTPIVEIIPYDRKYHGISDAKFPSWVVEPIKTEPMNICVRNEIAERINERDLNIIIDVLKQDVRSRRSRSAHQDGTFCHSFCGGKIFGVYRYRIDGICLIDCADVASDDECEKLFGSLDLANRVREGFTSGRAPEVLEVIKSMPLLCSHKS